MTQTNTDSGMVRNILRVSLEDTEISSDISEYCEAIVAGEEGECTLCLTDTGVGNGVKTKGKRCNCKVLIHLDCLKHFWKKNGMRCLICHKSMA